MDCVFSFIQYYILCYWYLVFRKKVRIVKSVQIKKDEFGQKTGEEPVDIGHKIDAYFKFQKGKQSFQEMKMFPNFLTLRAIR